MRKAFALVSALLAIGASAGATPTPPTIDYLYTETWQNAGVTETSGFLYESRGFTGPINLHSYDLTCDAGLQCVGAILDQGPSDVYAQNLLTSGGLPPIDTGFAYAIFSGASLSEFGTWTAVLNGLDGTATLTISDPVVAVIPEPGASPLLLLAIALSALAAFRARQGSRNRA